MPKERKTKKRQLEIRAEPYNLRSRTRNKKAKGQDVGVQTEPRNCGATFASNHVFTTKEPSFLKVVYTNRNFREMGECATSAVNKDEQSENIAVNGGDNKVKGDNSSINNIKSPNEIKKEVKIVEDILPNMELDKIDISEKPDMDQCNEGEQPENIDINGRDDEKVRGDNPIINNIESAKEGRKDGKSIENVPQNMEVDKSDISEKQDIDQCNEDEQPENIDINGRDDKKVKGDNPIVNNIESAKEGKKDGEIVEDISQNMEVDKIDIIREKQDIDQCNEIPDENPNVEPLNNASPIENRDLNRNADKNAENENAISLDGNDAESHHEYYDLHDYPFEMDGFDDINNLNDIDDDLFLRSAINTTSDFGLDAYLEDENNDDENSTN